MLTKGNTSGISPLGRAVLVEYYEPERKESLIVIPEAIKDRTVMVEQRATVVECGPACWPTEPARARPGDRVLIAKFSGYAAVGPADGKRYRLINDNDIFAKITHDEGHITGDRS
jgi:co-chaperonin GroES (HSP10)